MGTSTFKYTTPLPCIGLSESDSTLYTKFEFCEGKNHKHLEKKNSKNKKHIDLQSQAMYVAEIDSNVKIFKVNKSKSKTIISLHLLSNTFNDNF